MDDNSTHLMTAALDATYAALTQRRQIVETQQTPIDVCVEAIDIKLQTGLSPYELLQQRDHLLSILPDPDKLRLLAKWFDKEQLSRSWWTGGEVQTDLIKWANAIALATGQEEKP